MEVVSDDDIELQADVDEAPDIAQSIKTEITRNALTRRVKEETVKREDRNRAAKQKTESIPQTFQGVDNGIYRIKQEIVQQTQSVSNNSSNKSNNNKSTASNASIRSEIMNVVNEVVPDLATDKKIPKNLVGLVSQYVYDELIQRFPSQNVNETALLLATSRIMIKLPSTKTALLKVIDPNGTVESNSSSSLNPRKKLKIDNSNKMSALMTNSADRLMQRVSTVKRLLAQNENRLPIMDIANELVDELNQQKSKYNQEQILNECIEQLKQFAL